MTRLALVLGLVSPALAFGGVRLELDQKAVVLGRTESVRVRFFVDEGERPLRVAVNVGSFAEVVRLDGGRYESVYIPPPTRFPQVALVAVWRETGPDAPIEFVRIPLHGITRVPVKTQAGSEVSVEVAGVTFGPATADRKGETVLPITVPPGVTEATVTSRPPSGAPTVARTTVDVPPYNRLTAAWVPHAIAADGHSTARIEVFYDLGGADVPADRVVVEASLGTVSFQRASNGRYVYGYVAPKGTAATEVRFRVSVKGDKEAQASGTIALGLPAAAKLALRAPDEPLSAGGGSQGTVRVLVLDATGMGLPSQRVSVRADGRALEVTELGLGAYEARYVAPDDYPPGGVVHFEAAAGALAEAVNYQLRPGAAAHEVVARFAPSPVPADGETEATLTVDVRNAEGAPLSARLLATVSHGTLGPLTRVAPGRYEASYRAQGGALPDDPRLKLVDEGGKLERDVPIPLRAAHGRLLAGARLGLTHSLGAAFGPRFGLEGWLRLGAFRLGVSAAYGWVSQSITDASTSVSTDARAHLVPVLLRVGWEAWAARRFSVVVGAGGGVVFARYGNTLTTEETVAVGGGALGFVTGVLALGPGQLFVELSYAFLPVSAASFRAQAGGLELSVGYRFAVL